MTHREVQTTAASTQRAVWEPRRWPRTRLPRRDPPARRPRRRRTQQEGTAPYIRLQPHMLKSRAKEVQFCTNTSCIMFALSLLPFGTSLSWNCSKNLSFATYVDPV